MELSAQQYIVIVFGAGLKGSYSRDGSFGVIPITCSHRLHLGGTSGSLDSDSVVRVPSYMVEIIGGMLVALVGVPVSWVICV